MKTGSYMSVGAYPEKMSLLPGLVCYSSIFLGLGSLAASYAYDTLSSGTSDVVVAGLGAFGCIALVSGFVLDAIYEKQKLGIGSYETEKGQFYNRFGRASIAIAMSFIITSFLFQGFSLDAYSNAAMVASCLAEGVGYASSELRDYADNEVPQRKAGGSLDESRKSPGFAGKLRSVNLIGSLKKKREDSNTLELLKRFNKEEEGYEDSIGTRVLLSNSNPGYGSIKTTTKL